MRGWITKVGGVVHDTFWGGEGGRGGERRAGEPKRLKKKMRRRRTGTLSLSLHTL